MSVSSNEKFEPLVVKLREFVAERDWSQFHDPKNLAMAIASEAGELLAELRWVASQDADRAVAEASLRGRVENEVGDIAIALLLFCERTGIDVLAAAEKKLAINAANYPVRVSLGRAERAKPSIESRKFSRVIAVDWSGKAGGGHETIWLAEVRGGELTALENGRSREEVTNHLIQITRADPNTVIGLDFAFAFPAWFATERNC